MISSETSHRIGVLGAGSWGTALAHLLADRDHEVTLWAREESIAKGINQKARNPAYVKEFDLSPNLRATHSLREAVADKEILVGVIPSHAVREVLGAAAREIRGAPIFVSASKGIENQSLLPMNEVLKQILPTSMHTSLCFLSGPSFAEEVLRKMPTAVTIASANVQAAETAQQAFAHDYFRTYTSNDVVGVELGGALKNVIAIATGMCDGLGYGLNSRAALITRGLSEIAALGQKLGANPLTFLGLAGMGDLILTCTGNLSRNRHVGLELGRGKKLRDILSGMSMVAEGVRTAKSVHDLAQREGIEMVICRKVYEILYEDAEPKQVVSEIMTRSLKSEFHWLKP